MFRKLMLLEKPFDFLRRAGGWFVTVLALSLLVRLWLVLFTEGTYDVEIWQHHAEEIQRIGLTAYYNASFGDIRQYNHPPVMGHIASLCLSLSAWLHLPFKVLFRLLFALQDFLIAFYLMRIFRASAYKYVCMAFYLLCPLTFILSSYHGNSDSSLGLFGLACLYYFSLGKYAVAGIILGAGTWVKWIAALLVPVMLFSAPGASTM
jgi:Gpi18-like mannosyltransferase